MPYFAMYNLCVSKEAEILTAKQQVCQGVARFVGQAVRTGTGRGSVFPSPVMASVGPSSSDAILVRWEKNADALKDVNGVERQFQQET